MRANLQAILFGFLMVVAVMGHLKLHREGLSSSHFLEESEFEIISHIVPSEGDPENKYMAFMDSILAMGNLNDSVTTCSKGKDFFKIGGQSVGRLGTKDDQNVIKLTQLEDDCFAQVTATYVRKDDLVSITLTPSDVGTCTEVFLLGTHLNYNMIWLNADGKSHTVHFRDLSSVELQNIEEFGFHLFRTCDTWQDFLPNLLHTVSLFFGGFTAHPHLGPIFGSKPAPWMEKHNVEFIEHATGYKWLDREQHFIDLDDTEVQSGDFLAITRFDGLDQIIQYGTGSHSGHSAVLLEVDGVLNVVESQDAWYWPKHKIQRNPWSEWKKLAKNAGFNVAVLPLSADARAVFDVKRAEAWFKTMEGFPYGYHNFVFGWIDTPDNNFPNLLGRDLAVVVFSVLQNIIPAQIIQLVGEGFNMRLGTKGLKFHEIQTELTKQGMDWGDLFSAVEKDEWIYSDGPSMVCSSFVIGIFKAGGLFDGMEVQATEFTPKDVYQLSFFDKNPIIPQRCRDADPDLPYCQIMGTHKMIMPGYSTIDPYPNMNEQCPSLAPEYNRPDGC